MPPSQIRPVRLGAKSIIPGDKLALRLKRWTTTFGNIVAALIPRAFSNLSHAFTLALLLALSNPVSAAPTVVTYPAPPGIPTTSDYAVSVDGRPSFVYTAPDMGKYTIFSFGDGPVHVRITTASVVTTVDVRPKALGIQPTFSAHTIEFDLAAPTNISVEVNGDLSNPLFVFANPLEVNKPSPADPNVIFFAAGQVYDQDPIQVPSGKTVYIEGGAYVKGRIRVGEGTPGSWGASNVAVLGRGVVDSAASASGKPSRIYNSSSVTFDGVVFVAGGGSWGVAAFGSSNLAFKNIKILNKDLYGDGLDVVSGSNAIIDGCFIRSGDDSIALKTDKFGWSGGVETVAVSNCVLWNAGYGKALQIGFETDSNYIRNVTFRDCDVIHKVAADATNENARAALSIETSQALVSNVYYENIRIEDCTQNYISLGLRGPAEIKEVYFKNISFLGAANALPIRLNGWDSTHKISNVTFDHLSFSEGPVADASQISLISDNTSNITFVGEKWVNASGGTWNNSSNWSAGTIANGVDRIADFSTLDLSSGATVTVDGPRSVGHLRFGDTTANKDWTINAGTGGNLTLAVTCGNPTINVVNRSATINTALTGSQDIQKTGSGALNLTGPNTHSGITVVAPGSGMVTVSGNQNAANGGWRIGANSSASTTVNFAAGSQVAVAAGKEIRIANTVVSGTSTQTLNVAGSVVNAGQLLVGRPAVLNLNSGGAWSQSGGMSVAAQGGYSAKLNVAAGSAFTYSGASTIKVNGAQGNSGQALLTIDGSFTTSAGFEQTTVPSSGYGRVTLQNGGALKLAANVPELFTGVQFVLGSNGGAIDTKGYATTLTSGITGSGGLSKRGAGVLTLSGANGFTGATIVEAGALSISGTLGNTSVTVANGATLDGVGVLNGAVVIQPGGVLTAGGVGIGTLTINNTLNLSGVTQLGVSNSGATLSADRVSGMTTVSYGGTLQVNNVGPDALTAGSSFTLFSATNRAGSFASISLPSLAAGLSWDTSKLSVDGSIAVRALPVAAADTATVAEDNPVSVPVLANDSDADGDALFIQAVTQGAYGSVSIAGANVTYAPAANWSGTDSFTYTITDNRDGIATATVTVTVSSVNDAPTFVFSPISKPAATEDATYAVSTLAGSAADLDAGDTLTYSKVSGPAWLNVAADGALSGTPLDGDVGANTFTVKVTDAAGAFALATLNMSVINTNDAPTFTANPLNKPDGTLGVAYSSSIAGNAMDVDAGDTLTFSKVSGPSWLNVASNGDLSGTPTGGAGIHSFTVRVADASGLSVDATLNIVVTGSLPTQWTGVDIGFVGIAGSASENNGVYSVSGSGSDIGGVVDSFQFISQTLGGDGEIRARVTSQSNPSFEPKAGVMIRDGSGAGAINAMMTLAPAGYHFQYRAAVSGNSSVSYGPALNAAPNNWIRLVRSGNLFTGYRSADGVAWTQVGSTTLNMSSTVSIGLAVCSRNNSGLSAATFDHVAVTTFPTPWQTMDIGATGLLGSAEYFGSEYTVKGAGTIGGSADKFRFVYQMLSGDGEITARIAMPQNTGTNARIGVMIRDTLTTNSPYAFTGVDGSGNFYWQRRRNIGSNYYTIPDGSGAAPNLWVRIVRAGSTFSGYKSTDGANWTSINSLSIEMGTNIYIGLAVASGSTTTLNSTVMDNVIVVP